MKCSQHPDRPTEKNCYTCGQPFCEDCIIDLAGQSYCRGCLESKVKQKPLSKTNRYAQEPKSRFLAFLLSFIPGVGYLYLGLMNRGLQTLILFFGTIFISDILGFGGGLISLVFPVLMFYTIFDTQQLNRRINLGEDVVDQGLLEINWEKISYKWVGFGLIILGLLALVENLAPMISLPFHLIRPILVPIIIIAIGIYILYKNTKS